jgi:hypothetical protein
VLGYQKLVERGVLELTHPLSKVSPSRALFSSAWADAATSVSVSPAYHNNGHLGMICGLTNVSYLPNQIDPVGVHTTLIVAMDDLLQM